MQAQNALHEYGGRLVADNATGNGATFEECKCVGAQLRTVRRDAKDRGASEWGQ